jgi:hypothetical protein
VPQDRKANWHNGLSGFIVQDKHLAKKIYQSGATVRRSPKEEEGISGESQ